LSEEVADDEVKKKKFKLDYDHVDCLKEVGDLN